MMTTTLIPGLSMCPEKDCEGQIYECTTDEHGGQPVYHCTDKPGHLFPAEELAACTRCDGPQNSDRETIEQALSATGASGDLWAYVDDKLVCPEHLVMCTDCGEMTLGDDAACAQGDAYKQCPSCRDDCGACASDAARETYYEHRGAR